MKREPGFPNAGQRDTPLFTLHHANHRDLGIPLAFDRDDLDFRSSTHVIADDVRLPANEPSPIGGVTQNPFDARRRDLQDVLRSRHCTRIEPGFDRARCFRAILDGDLFAIQPIHSDVDHRPPLRAALPQLDQLEAECVKLLSDNGFQ